MGLCPSPNFFIEASNLFSITGHHKSSNLLRYVPENRSSPRVVTGKLQNWKLTSRLNNKTCTNPQIKNHKKSHEL
jgi:hypothetical protein